MFPGPLRAFYEAIRCGSIRKASETLNLAPSSVSRQILILERQMGTALFDRSTSGVSLTHAGKLMAEYARTAILDYDSLRADINDLKGGHHGLVRIATVEGSVSEAAVAAVLAFKKRFAGVTFQVNMLPARRVVDAVKMGASDVGLTFCGEPDVDLKYETRVADPIVLAVSPRSELANLDVISLDQLQHVTLALPEAGFSIRRLIDRATQTDGYVLTPTLSSDSFVALKAFAISDGGAAVLTRQAIRTEEDLGLLKGVPIASADLQNATVDIVTLKKRRLSSLLKFFLIELKRVTEGEQAMIPRSRRDAAKRLEKSASLATIGA